MRTFNDWNDPPPGFFEMDMVAYCGKSVAGSHVHSLVLTDIASGWTEAAAMVVREQPSSPSRRGDPAEAALSGYGLDVDNDSAFINETVVEYCNGQKIELAPEQGYPRLQEQSSWPSGDRNPPDLSRIESMSRSADFRQGHDYQDLP